MTDFRWNKTISFGLATLSTNFWPNLSLKTSKRKSLNKHEQMYVKTSELKLKCKIIRTYLDTDLTSQGHWMILLNISSTPDSSTLHHQNIQQLNISPVRFSFSKVSISMAIPEELHLLYTTYMYRGFYCIFQNGALNWSGDFSHVKLPKTLIEWLVKSLTIDMNVRKTI